MGLKGSEWHPVFLTSEPSPGVWVMKSKHEREPFGRVEIRRVKDGVRYRVTLSGQVIGWATSFQVARERLYLAHLAARTDVHSGPPNGRR
jgi:hypothetical protein